MWHKYTWLLQHVACSIAAQHTSPILWCPLLLFAAPNVLSTVAGNDTRKHLAALGRCLLRSRAVSACQGLVRLLAINSDCPCILLAASRHSQCRRCPKCNAHCSFETQEANDNHRIGIIAGGTGCQKRTFGSTVERRTSR